MPDIIQGIHIFYSADGASYTEITSPQSFPELEEKPDYVEVTPINVTDKHRRYVTGLKDTGETSFEAILTKAEWDAIKALSDESHWRIQFDDYGDQVDFPALATATRNSGSAGDKFQSTISLRTNGAPIWSDTV